MNCKENCKKLHQSLTAGTGGAYNKKDLTKFNEKEPETYGGHVFPGGKKKGADAEL